MYKRFLHAFAVAVSVCLLAGCAAAVIGGAAAGGVYAASSDRTAGTVTDDAAITSAINRLYVKDTMISALDINVDTYRGNVTLNGNVSSQAIARRAVELARGVNGVRQVVNRLKVVQR